MAGVFDIDIDDGMQRVSLMKFAFKIGSSDSFTNSESTNGRFFSTVFINSYLL